LLQRKLKNLPNSAGVYKYFDKFGKVLYIGKAKNLKKRVLSYFNITTLTPSKNLSLRISKMVSEVFDIEYIIVNSESDALVLENSLIKEFKPKYNVLLRDDKSYPYIYIDLDVDFPRFEITRRKLEAKNIKYFGPFPKGCEDIFKSLYELFKLKQNSKCKKKCLFFQIERCLAPCEQCISKDDYKLIIEEAVKNISNIANLVELLNQRMLFLAQNLRFEEAKEIRDRINLIQTVQIKSGVEIDKNENIDIFTLTFNADKVALSSLFIRNGRVISSEIEIFDNIYEINEIYKRAIINFYTDSLIIPNEILIAHEIDLEDILLFLNDKFRAKIVVPKRGRKLELVELAKKNGLEKLKFYDEKVEKDIQKLFNLSNYPDIIEVVDVSHNFLDSVVGGIVYYKDGFIKSNYRHYNLNSTDEYSQMRELISRRVNSATPLPKLFIIDGGAKQLEIAIELLPSNIDVIAIAKAKVDGVANRGKGIALDTIYTKDNIFKLDFKDKRLQFVQKLRDEAHRFSLNFHKKQKLKQDKKVSITEIKGIKEAKLKKLLNYFGTFKNIKNAPLEELMKFLTQKEAETLIEKSSF